MAHLTLFQFNQKIKESLQDQINPQQWIIAEIGEMRSNQKGHCYMELVEKEGNFIQAKIRANIWAYQYKTIGQSFLKATGTALAPGQKVLLNVSVNFHEVYGLSLTVNDIDPNFTLGERTKQREATIDRLRSLNAFDKNKSLELPLVPQHIAIISSESAAGYQDFVEQLKKNNRGIDFSLTLHQATMQGDTAPQSIIAALDKVEKVAHADLIVIIRGGGAQTDLDCFDDEALCLRMSSSKLPILTGIGHQRDQTIADLVAHTALKTPTAVAEFIINGVYQFDDQLHEALLRIRRGFENSLQLRLSEINTVELQIKSAFHHQYQKAERVLEQLQIKLKNRSDQRLKALSNELKSLTNIIHLNDPYTIFKKGYTMTLMNGKSIRKQEIRSGDELLTLGEGVEIKSTVN